MKKDYECREFSFKEDLTKEELKKLVERMKKQGFNYEHYDNEKHSYYFVKFY